jgi:hypothetical protein
MKRAAVIILGALLIAATINCGRAAPGSNGNQANDPNAPARQGPKPQAKTVSGDEVRMLKFSGYDWKVKKSGGSRVGPGQNYFSDAEDNIRIDEQGRLHIRITQREGRWYCAEIVSAQSFGYGTYRFYVDSNVDRLDPVIVLGLFTWNDDAAYNHREIDIEISRWGKIEDKNAQYVIQPYTRPQNIVRFRIPPRLDASTHSFKWEANSVFCQSLKGLDAGAAADSVIEQHTFTQGIPKPGGENARINLWLMAGRPPSDNSEAELIISKFEFLPLQ